MAVKILYSLADHEGGSLEKVLNDFWKNFQFNNDILGEVSDGVISEPQPEVREFAEQIVHGVAENLEKLDDEIKSY